QEEPNVAKEEHPEYTVGTLVVHKTFGPGTITSLDDRYMTVKFALNEKKFLYPDCFEKGFFE
ncbi:MAG: hypothetical protein ACI4C3_04055, partial [Bacteroides sp.]